jgi:hypothetical protein
MSEHQEQTTFFDWVRLERESAPNTQVRKALKLCYAVPNGASMKDSQRVRMCREGMTKGILDINLDWPDALEGYFEDAHYSGLRIEMKFGKNRLTKEQKEKKSLLEEAGFKVAVCYSAVEAIRAVFEYLPFAKDIYQGVTEFLNTESSRD